MSENFSFRSSLNGFNRSDVMACIEKILSEKSAVDEKVSVLEANISSLEEKCTLIEKENESIKNENLEKLASYDRQLKEMRAVELKSLSLEKELENALAEIENLRFLLQKTDGKSVEKDKCSECELARIYEARLGAAMLDAKRFSEILVKEANDKASGLFASAFSAADATSLKAKEIAAEISSINEQFNSAFRHLLDNMHHLDSSLESFKSDVNTTGTTFDFSTEFEPIKMNSAVFSSVDTGDSVSVEKNITVSSSTNSGITVEAEHKLHQNTDVNFDDADEFDIKVDLNAWKKY